MRGLRSLWPCLVAVAAALAATRSLPAQQNLPPDREQIAVKVRADLAKLSDLERAYYAANGQYTTDIKALNFTPSSGAVVAVSYASARTFSASASHFRLAPFICFVIVTTSDAKLPDERPFCTDSRFGTAASALANAGIEPEPTPARAAPPPLRPAAKAGSRPTAAIEARAPGSASAAQPSRPPLTQEQFAERLRATAKWSGDSSEIVVQFSVREARYDPSRGVIEVAVDPVPMPLEDAAGAPAARKSVLACFTRPAFVCGEAGLTYIARDVFRVPRSSAPDPEVVRAGLSMQARFALGRRDDTVGPALTLLALLLQANGTTVSHWERAISH